MTVSFSERYEVENATWQVLDYIPLVSTVSGAARTIFGVCEATLGIVAFPVQLGMRCVGSSSRFLFNLGISNIIRGKVACIPILGNVTLYAYDHLPNIRSDIQNLFGLSVWHPPRSEGVPMRLSVVNVIRE